MRKEMDNKLNVVGFA